MPGFAALAVSSHTGTLYRLTRSHGPAELARVLKPAKAITNNSSLERFVNNGGILSLIVFRIAMTLFHNDVLKPILRVRVAGTNGHAKNKTNEGILS